MSVFPMCLAHPVLSHVVVLINTFLKQYIQQYLEHLHFFRVVVEIQVDAYNLIINSQIEVKHLYITVKNLFTQTR